MKKKLLFVTSIILTISIIFSLSTNLFAETLNMVEKPEEIIIKDPIFANFNVHDITSDKPYNLLDGTTDKWYNSRFMKFGKTIISWKDDTRHAFWNAKIILTNGVKYEFQLTKTISCNDDYIKGYFNIYKNGLLVEPKKKGELYGLNQSVGNYFKFYTDDFKWHMSFYITYRFDY